MTKAPGENRTKTIKYWSIPTVQWNIKLRVFREKIKNRDKEIRRCVINKFSQRHEDIKMSILKGLQS